MDYKRVRKRVLWQDGNYRMIRFLIVYGGGDGTWEAPFYTSPHMYWEVQEQRHTDWLGDGWYTLHELTHRGFVNNDYLYASAKKRRRITGENARRGREWLDRHLRLKAAEPWEVRCDSVDGEGTPCPIQRDGHCPITKWYGTGYAGHWSADRPLPGMCSAPKTQSVFPSDRDGHDNTHRYYRDLLKEKNDAPKLVCSHCRSVIQPGEPQRTGDDGLPLCADCYGRRYDARDAADEWYQLGDIQYDESRLRDG